MEKPAQSDTSVPNVSGADLSIEESKQEAEQSQEPSEIEGADCPDEKIMISESPVVHAAARMEQDGHMEEMKSTPPVPAKTAPKKLNLSVKLIGAYIPPPKPRAQRRRKSTVKHARSSLHI